MSLNFEQSIELYKEGFEESEDDLLARKRTGEALSDLLNRIENPQVVALDGKWGSGKTWFLQRWVHFHQNKFKNETVVYFDAFAHDYISDPLPALVSELEGRTKDKIIKRIKRAVFKLAKPISLAGTRAILATTTYGISETAGVIGGKLIKTLGDQAEKNLEEYWKQELGRSVAMEQFRMALSTLASKSKVIFVVDELDRCRPDYALEVLEVIKHFFSVPHVHFVLGVNLKALENMVSTRYGAEIDAREYLEKFIQVRLELPEETNEINQQNRNVFRYLDYLCREMEVPNHIGKWLKIRIKLVSRNNPVSLRQIEHIVSAVALASPASREESPSGQGGAHHDGWYGVMVDLIVSRIVCPGLYPRFLDATITPDELQSYLGYSDSLPTLYPKSPDKLFHELQSNRGNSNSIPDQGFDLEDWKWVFDTWLLITQTENEVPVLGNVIPNRKREIGQTLFGRDFVPEYISEYKVNELPKMIQREWLDLFQFYKPSSG
ncbi:MAG: P-loop NTPase fold protein [Paracoccaceae bacterium]|nr:P-loop NTPase fold protein [Paracoccaceae bacterium]MYJ86270.1 hypothetical protein [Paracoccaceae bacterium]